MTTAEEYRIEILEADNARLREEATETTEAMNVVALKLIDATDELVRLRSANDKNKAYVLELESECDRLREDLNEALAELEARPKVYFPQEDVPVLLAERDRLREERDEARHLETMKSWELARLREELQLRDEETMARKPVEAELASLRKRNNEDNNIIARLHVQLEQANKNFDVQGEAYETAMDENARLCETLAWIEERYPSAVEFARNALKETTLRGPSNFQGQQGQNFKRNALKEN